MLPLIACDLMSRCSCCPRRCACLADKAHRRPAGAQGHHGAALDRNPILVTALNPVIGYEQAAKIAKRAYAEGRPVLDVALEDSGLDEKTLRRLLDPADLAKGGIKAGTSSS
jgi:fumarate hydratase class II